MKNLLIMSLLSVSMYSSEPNYHLSENVYPIELSKCATCHNLLKDQVIKDKAPDMRFIVQNIKAKYSTKLDQKNFLYNFLENPSGCDMKSKVLCEEHSLKKYGLMKDIELNSRESLLIVNYLIDFF